MLLVPGWDGQRLRVAPPSEVEAARWFLYAEAMRPIVQEPYAQRLEVARIEAMKPGKARERETGAHEKRRIESLTQLIRQQADVRKALQLDDEDDA